MGNKYFSRYHHCPQREEKIAGLGIRRVYGPIATRSFEPAQFHTIIQGDRLDLLAHRYYDDASKWWVIADANQQLLRITELPNQLTCEKNIGAKLLIPHNPIRSSG